MAAPAVAPRRTFITDVIRSSIVEVPNQRHSVSDVPTEYRLNSAVPMRERLAAWQRAGKRLRSGYRPPQATACPRLHVTKNLMTLLLRRPLEPSASCASRADLLLLFSPNRLRSLFGSGTIVIVGAIWRCVLRYASLFLRWCSRPAK
jgi:hypothetical protein